MYLNFQLSFSNCNVAVFIISVDAITSQLSRLILVAVPVGYFSFMWFADRNA